jgi:hypothetical protein
VDESGEDYLYPEKGSHRTFQAGDASHTGRSVA